MSHFRTYLVLRLCPPLPQCRGPGVLAAYPNARIVTDQPSAMLEELEAEDRRQKTEDRRQETEDRRQETEDRRRETGDGRRETGGRIQNSGVRRQNEP